MTVVFRRGSKMALRPIHRIKHVVDTSATLAAGALFSFDLVKSVDAPVLGNTSEVETASKVYGIYLKVIVASNEAQVAGAIPNVYMFIAKNPAHALTLMPANAVGSNDEKRYILHQEMTMIQNVISSNPSVLFNGVVKIPKGFARMGPNDRIQIDILCPAINISLCVQGHYKEFR